MRRLSAFIACLTLASAVPARATPISWQFQGLTSSVGIPDIPVGTPVQLTWSFDSAEPDTCGFGSGVYQHQNVALQIGSLAYQASGFLIANQNLSVGCSGATSEMELRLASWTGPDISTGVLAGLLPYPPGLFWTNPVLNGALPGAPPPSAYLEGPIFIGRDGLQAVSANVYAVPEPSTIVLVLSGAAAVGLLAFRRRRPSPVPVRSKGAPR